MGFGLKIKIKFKDLSLSNKLFFSFSAVFIPLILLIFWIIGYYFNANITKSLFQVLENSTSLAVEIVSSHATATIRNHLRSEAEKNVAILDYIEKEGTHNGLSLGVRQKKAAQYLQDQTIGMTGYPYVLDEQGVLLVHPFENLIGQSIIEHDFVQIQVEEKTGYLEYLWQNSVDDFPRRKALYMVFYEPWRWILSVSTYRSEFRSLIHIDEVGNAIKQMQVGAKGAIFVCNGEGDILIHPDLEGTNFRTLDESGALSPSFFEEMTAMRNGVIEYECFEPDGKEKEEKILMYRYLPEFDWFVVSSVSMENLSSLRDRINNLLAGILILSIVLFLFLSRSLAHNLTRPLSLLVDFIDTVRGSDYSERFRYDSRDEVHSLVTQVNDFLSALQREGLERKKAEEQRRVLASYSEENPYPILRVDGTGKILYANPASSLLLENWHASDSLYLPADLTELILECSDQSGSVEYQMDPRFYRIIISHFNAQNPFYLFVQDITNRKNNESLLLMSESVFFNTKEGIIITDPNGIILRVNPAFVEITGYAEEDAVGRKTGLLKSSTHSDEFYRDMWNSLLKKGSWSGELWNRRKSGEAYPEWLTINSIYDEQGNLIHYVALFRDISDIKRSEEQLRYQAYHDALTGLPNRVLFEDRLGQAIFQAERHKIPLAVLFLDMDNFKTINDSLGHNTGDAFLKLIAKRLYDSCRGEDTVARLGGDEFVILLQDLVDRKSIVEIVQRIYSFIREPVIFEGHEIVPSVSIGVTFFPEDGENSQLLMRNADMAMYESKQKGKNTYTLYNQEMNRQFQKRIEMEGRLNKALERDEFHIVYQPKITSSDQVVMGVEALIRWNSPDLGAVPPSDFIDLAEETGIILDVGDWILKKALADLRIFQSVAGENFEMAVNLSARQFRDPRLISRINTILEQSGVPRYLVNLEITENMAMEDSETAVDILQQLYDLDVKISIDDFGTGYSSYSYLRRFKTNSLKIDKTFVDELPGEGKSMAIIQNLIDLGHSLGMEVVAEGVETEAQFLFLKDAGCEIIQGFYFSAPLKKDDLLLFLKEQCLSKRH